MIFLPCETFLSILYYSELLVRYIFAHLVIFYSHLKRSNCRDFLSLIFITKSGFLNSENSIKIRKKQQAYTHVVKSSRKQGYDGKAL